MKTWTTKSGQVIYRLSDEMYNCYLVSYRDRHFLVDTGRKNRLNMLSRELDRLGVNNNSLACLILTHSHYDHAGNAADIKNTFNATIIIHKNEADYLHKGENPAIHGTTFFTRFITEGLSSWYLTRYCRYKPVDSDIQVEDPYDLNNFGFNAYIIHTPGHTNGSISVIIDNEIALVGDALFGVFKGTVLPPFAADSRLIVDSWKRLLSTGCAMFLPAHGRERSKELLLQQYNKHKSDNIH